MVVVVVALAVALLTRVPARPNPDPRGRILATVSSARAAIPPGATVRTSSLVPPQWDSCDGMAGTFGYDAAVLDATFTTRLDVSAVLGDAISAMRRGDWSVLSERPHAKQGAVVRWRKHLGDGTWASALLADQLGNSPSYWEIFAQAPPAAGAASHGC